MTFQCPEKCFKEAIAFDDIIQGPTSTNGTCSDKATACENHIRFDFSNGELGQDGEGGFLQQLVTTDPATIAIIAGSSSAATMILVGIVIGIARFSTKHAV